MSDIFRMLWKRVDSHGSSELAAQVAFYFSLSIFPFLLVLVSILGWVPTTSRWGTFAKWLSAYFPTQAQNLILTTMLQLSHDYAGFLSLGLIVALWSASSGFLSLMEALSVAYDAKDGRSYVKRRIIAICATLVAALFLIITFSLWNLGHLLAGFVSADLRFFYLFSTPWILLRWCATFVLLCVAIDLISYFLPGTKRQWRWITPGTVFVALAFVIATFLLNLYLAHGSNIPRIYGTLTGFIVLMLWIYTTNLILLVGAETDSALAQVRSKAAGVWA
jgi:membrane protein